MTLASTTVGYAITVLIVVWSLQTRLLSQETAALLEPGSFEWHPERASSGPVVVIVSLPDQQAYVYRNGFGSGARLSARDDQDIPRRPVRS